MSAGWSDPRRAEFERLHPEGAHAVRRRENLTMLVKASEAAAVDLDKLARGGEWQRFQQIIQGALDAARSDLDKLMPQFLDPSVSSHDALLERKMQGIMLRERIANLELVLGLPKRLQDEADGVRAQAGGVDALLEESGWPTEK